MTWRSGPRRTASYQAEEEYAEDMPEGGQEGSGKSKAESNESQNTKANKKSTDQDVLLLLEKINLQLENMRLSEQNQQQDFKALNQEPNQENGLDKLVTQLLNSTNQNSANQDESLDNMQNTNDANSLLNQLLKQTNSQQSSQTQQKSKPQKPNSNTLVLQTAAEVLSRAQYELSNELETSLKKLKQVISESEQIANKISNLLEQKQQ